MNLLRFFKKHTSLVFLKTNIIDVDGKRYNININSRQELANILSSLPIGSTSWIIDDILTKSLILRDIAKVPLGRKTRAKFFNWRYCQELLLEDAPQATQMIQLRSKNWLVIGLPQEYLDTLIDITQIANRPIYKLLPRWIWLYNSLSDNVTESGMLLSLSSDDNEFFTGTITVWDKQLILLRQWKEAASIRSWHNERVLPTIAYLKRDSIEIDDLYIWGLENWCNCNLRIHIISPEIFTQEFN